MMKVPTHTHYGISTRYEINVYPEQYDDNSEEVDPFKFQREVYELARSYARRIESHFTRKVILDYGCGSGFKLLHYFSDSDFKTVGVDLKHIIEATSSKHGHFPNTCWMDSAAIWNPGILKSLKVDMLIAADVIEHLHIPEKIFDIAKECGKPLVVLSTPARDLYPKYYKDHPWGPPENKAHIREWTYEEFDNWLMNYFEYHELQITSYEHCTMTAIGWLKESF